jgi:leucyl/phenylalanyl-tRNA--protein transferase
MPEFLLPDQNNFPDVRAADEDGLIAIGSNLNPDTLLKAYQCGIFPWFMESGLIFWYHPDPRFVLYPDELQISHSMRNVLNKNMFRFSIDTAFQEVTKNCRYAKRKGQPGSWINDEFEEAYQNLFLKGYAHSAEAWQNNELVGGLYGVLLGKVFFGESMFSNTSNASKFAFIKMVDLLKKNGIELIDCQVYSPHLESLGAKLISRKNFLELLNHLVVQ